MAPMSTKTVHASQNLLSRTLVVHAPATPDSDYYLCRPPGTKGLYGPSVSIRRTSSPVECKACVRKLEAVQRELASIMDPVAFDPRAVPKNIGQDWDKHERQMTALEHARRALAAGWRPPPR